MITVDTVVDVKQSNKVVDLPQKIEATAETEEKKVANF